MNSSSKSLSPSRKLSAGGFTLIELLVVIAIIAVLASILFPVFARVRENARRTSCQSNEKQLTLAFHQYAQDYDERMPCGITIGTTNGGNWWTIGQGWAGQLYSYTQSTQVFKCPSDLYKPSGTNVPISYGYNNNLLIGVKNITDGSNMAPISGLNQPSKTILLTEGTSANLVNIVGGEPTGWPSPIMNGFAYCNGWRVNNDGQAYCSAGNFGLTGFPCGSFQGPGKDSRNPDGRHLEGSNFAFFDGHVKWMKGGGISPGRNAATPTSAQTDPFTGRTAGGTSGFLTDGVTPVAATYSIN